MLLDTQPEASALLQLNFKIRRSSLVRGFIRTKPDASAFRLMYRNPNSKLSQSTSYESHWLWRQMRER